MSTPNAIVTGSASGLGRAIAVRLARDGWHIALVDINEQGNRETLDLVCSSGGSGQVESLDVSQPDQWLDLRERLQSQWPALDLLVNAAGVCGGGEMGDFALDNWRWLLDVNLHGTIFGCHAMVPWLKANPRGSHLTNIASIAAFISAPMMSAYNVSKAGVLSLSETLHGELAPYDVGVTVLCPPFVATALLDGGRFDSPALHRVASDYMRKAKLTPDDIAEVAVASIGSKQLYLVPGNRARWYWRLKRWIPKTWLSKIASEAHKRVARASNQPGSTAALKGEQSLVERPMR